MTVYEALMFAVAFATLIIAILSFDQKKQSTLELTTRGGLFLPFVDPPCRDRSITDRRCYSICGLF
ncbi:hypothetical protein GCM10007216_04960 [Thalassobacillus devorans]|uniref:Uncharacterized protein n=1 Tax=Thalassobacillus devorans TaxID=279813 RepID=A0ABQ1NHK9_9BACI|nr:putative holin-like toxin [Thalassobacillus devorans]GGC77446.1 hypothetical protein GCM10007216_04960 [Thalassobacillus devorans]